MQLRQSRSSWAGGEGLQAAANLGYTWAFKTVIRRVDDLTLGFSQEVLMWLEQSHLLAYCTLGEI